MGKLRLGREAQIHIRHGNCAMFNIMQQAFPPFSQWIKKQTQEGRIPDRDQSQIRLAQQIQKRNVSKRIDVRNIFYSIWHSHHGIDQPLAKHAKIRTIRIEADGNASRCKSFAIRERRDGPICRPTLQTRVVCIEVINPGCNAALKFSPETIRVRNHFGGGSGAAGKFEHAHGFSRQNRSLALANACDMFDIIIIGCKRNLILILRW